MGLGNIRRVVQYMIPRSLTQFTQRTGVVGRDGKPALSILLVEPTIFQKVHIRTVLCGEATSKNLKDGAEIHHNIDQECVCKQYVSKILTTDSYRISLTRSRVIMTVSVMLMVKISTGLREITQTRKTTTRTRTSWSPT
jgi:superfamily II DNA/RNA helicase